MATVYKSNGECYEVQPKNGTDFKLEELHNIIGGYIETISIGNDKIMIVDEEGKLKGRQFNKNATLLFQLYNGNSDFIVGTALVCKKSEIV